MSIDVFISSKLDRLLIRVPMSFNNSVATYIHTKTNHTDTYKSKQTQITEKPFSVSQKLYNEHVFFFYTMDFPRVFSGM